MAEAISADQQSEDAPRKQRGRAAVKQSGHKGTITKTTITPSPGVAPVAAVDHPPATRLPRPRRRSGERHGDLATPQAPLPGSSIVRVVMAVVLGALCAITIAAGILMMLLWQQQRGSGVLSTQLDRVWNIFDRLREVERLVAFAVVPVVVAWIALASMNIRRATGHRRTPIVGVAAFLAGVAGVWYVGHRVVAPADDWVQRGGGMALQALVMAIPLLALDRVADATEARRRPLRATYFIAVAFLVHLQAAGAVSTIEESRDPERWGMLAAYLVIAGLIQVLGSLAANEACRAIDDATQHRYLLRHRFGESLLAQAGLMDSLHP